jgi:hypothetical protein
VGAKKRPPCTNVMSRKFAAEAHIYFQPVSAPFDYAQGGLLKPCPFKATKGNRRSFDSAEVRFAQDDNLLIW